MSVIAGTKSLMASLRKLEVAAVERQKACAYCRYMRELQPLLKGQRLEPEEVATKRYEFCRAELTVSLFAEWPLHSYIFKNGFLYTCEQLYTDRAVNALSIWGSHMLPVIHIRLGFGDDRNGDAGNKPRRNPALEKLRRESDRLLMRRLRRLRAKHGEPFPEHGEIVKSVVNRGREHLSFYFHLEEVKRLYQHETNFLVCAEMEKILWGRVSPATESDLNELRRRMSRLVAEEGHPPRAEQEAEEKRLGREAERLRHREGPKRRTLEPARRRPTRAA
jgi:hypothetical protein